MAAPRLPYGPSEGVLVETSVADSLESTLRTLTTCASWSEDCGSLEGDERAQNPARSEDVALHMLREQVRNGAADVHSQVRRALDQAAPPLLEGQDTNTGAFPTILEQEHEPVHTRESLHSIISRFNSLETKNGAVGTLLDANSVGMAMPNALAFANVPTSMIVFTSRPLTAILTRWPMMVFLFSYAMVFLYPCLVDVHTVVWGSSISMQWLQVHEVKVYESVFPTLGREDTRLTLVDAGIYDNSLNRRLIPGCNTTLLESSFEIRCAESVPMQGIWLHVVGANKQSLRGVPSRPHYEHAGIQFAHTIGPDDAARGTRSPGIEDIYNVLGTGQTIRGSAWEVRSSETGLDGIFRLPHQMARPPLLERSRREICEFFAYSSFGLLILMAWGCAVTGHTRVAKQMCVLAAAYTAIAFFGFHFVEAVRFFARERRLALAYRGAFASIRRAPACLRSATACRATRPWPS